MSDYVETMAYRGETPWHGFGIEVSNDTPVSEMLDKAGLNWTVSKRPLYFPKKAIEGQPTSLRIVPAEYALVRDSDESVLDTVGENFKPVQNEEILDFFKRYVEAGDMEMETAGSLKNGKFIWGLARFKGGDFSLDGKDEHRGYVLLSQPHQFGFSLTVALTPIRVVCWNTINYALGSKLDGSSGNTKASFRMVHSRLFDDKVKAEAEVALGLAQQGMAEYSHTAEFLSKTRAKDEAVTDYFRTLLNLDKPEDDTEAAQQEAEEEETRNMKRLREALTSAPGQELPTAKGTWFGAVNAVTYMVDHQLGRTDDNRLVSAWFGNGSSMKRKAVAMAVDFAKAA